MISQSNDLLAEADVGDQRVVVPMTSQSNAPLAEADVGDQRVVVPMTSQSNAPLAEADVGDQRVVVPMTSQSNAPLAEADVGHQRVVVPMITPSRAGFTLVEMMVVIAILAVVAGVTAPAIRDLHARDPLQSATQEVTTLLGRAQRTSVERGLPVRVMIDPATHRYRVYALPHGAVADSVTSDSLRLADDVRLDARTGRHLVVLFQPTGEARGDTLMLHWQGHAAAVSADAWMGEAHVAVN